MAWWKEQIGPLPAGAWIAVLAGGLGLSYFVSRGAANKILAEPGISTGTPEGVAEGPGPGLTPISTGPIPVGPVTNEEWAARAIEELAARGHPIELVEPAITHYVAGSKLTAAETVYKNLAIGILGYPPLPIPITPIPIPITPAGGPPAKPRVRAQQLGRTVVLISWAPAARAVTYEIRRVRGGTPGTGEPWIPIGSALTYTAVARPVRRTQFAFDVRGRNTSGVSIPARTPTFTLG